MLTTKMRGDAGETIAAEYLKGIGYEIIDRNYRTELGEVDIIAAGEGYLIFVEVKTRLNEDHGYGADAVNFRKRRKINEVASRYIKQYRLYDQAVRFDIIEVYTQEKRVEHIKNAFDSYLRY